MTVWHGTTNDLLPDILRDGLRDNPARKFSLYLPEKGDLPEDRYVHVTRLREHAEWYAQFRARFSAVAPGECFDYEAWSGFNGYHERIGPKRWCKTSIWQAQDAKPALLKLDVPARSLRRDKEDPLGLVTPSLPPKAIVGAYVYDGDKFVNLSDKSDI